MGNQDASITLSIIAKDLASGNIGKAVSGLDALAKKGGLVGSMAQGVGMQFGMMLNPIGRVTDFLKDSIASALAEDKQLARLGQTLQANVKDWDGSTAAVDRATTAAMDLAFSDDDARESMITLITATGNVEQSVRDLSLAEDIARGRNIDLASATNIVIKANMGNVGALRKLGIEIDKGATSTEILATLQERYSGQAETYANTTAGKFEAAQVKVNDAMENFGHILITDTANLGDLTHAADGTSQGLTDAVREMGLLGLAPAGLADEMQAAIDKIGFVADSIPKAIIVPIGTAAAAGVAAAADAMTLAASTGTERFYDYWKTHALPAAHTAGEEVMHSLATGMRDSEGTVHDEWKQFVKDLNKPFDAMKEIAFLNGKLTGHRLAEGLASSDPITKANAETMRDHIVAQLADLKALGYDIGDGTGNHVAAGLDDSTPAAVTQAQQLVDAVNARLQRIINDVHVRFAISGKIGGIDYGQRAAGGPVRAGVPYIVGEHRPELFVPNQNGYVQSSVPSAAVGPGVTLNVSFASLAPPTASQGQAVAQAIMPELVREMRRQRIM
jgi:hypothetical protein